MQVLLLGAGTVTSRLNMQLAEQGHSVVAQIAAFTPQHIDLFDFRALIVVSPESSVSPESLVKAAERGKLIFVIAGVGRWHVLLGEWCRRAGPCLSAFGCGYQ